MKKIFLNLEFGIRTDCKQFYEMIHLKIDIQTTLSVKAELQRLVKTSVRMYQHKNTFFI